MLRRWLDRLYLAAGGMGAACVALIGALMIGQSVAREFGVRTGAINDIVAWLCAAAAFLAMAHAFKHGDFVRVTLLLENLGPRWRHVFELVSLAIATLFTGYIAWSITLYVMDSRTFGDMAGGLVVIPIWIPQSSLAIGSFLLFVAVADQFVHVLRGNRPDYVVAVEERHARGDFSEDV